MLMCSQLYYIKINYLYNANHKGVQDMREGLSCASKLLNVIAYMFVYLVHHQNKRSKDHTPRAPEAF